MKINLEIVTGNFRVQLENKTWINRYSHIMAGAEIGENSMIGQGCYVGSTAKIGSNTRIQNGNNIWDGVEIGSNVFIGPQCVLTNHHDPTHRLRGEEFKPDKTIIKDYATICAGAVIVAPCTIEEYGVVAAGSVLLRDVDKKEKVYGLVKKLKQSIAWWKRND